MTNLKRNKYEIIENCRKEIGLCLNLNVMEQHWLKVENKTGQIPEKGRFLL